MSKKYTEHYIDVCINYLNMYKDRLNEQITSYTSMYDFDVEHALVEKCEAGEMLSVELNPTRDNE